VNDKDYQVKHDAYAQTNSRGEVVDKHDRAYVDARDALIPLAEAVADAEHPAPTDVSSLTGPQQRAWKASWDRAFHGAMNRLAAQATGGEVH
jgi:hypothetical protein